MTTYEIINKNGHETCKQIIGDIEVCTCEISINKVTNTWNINAWYTKEGFKNKGYGKATMHKLLAHCIEKYGEPNIIQYTWNGTNAYVMNWLERCFDAICTCPIAIQKTQSEDDWDSHIYELNKEKVLVYFKLKNMPHV